MKDDDDNDDDDVTRIGDDFHHYCHKHSKALGIDKLCPLQPWGMMGNELLKIPVMEEAVHFQAV